jgi:hypothetical protein
MARLLNFEAGVPDEPLSCFELPQKQAEERSYWAQSGAKRALLGTLKHRKQLNGKNFTIVQ